MTGASRLAQSTKGPVVCRPAQSHDSTGPLNRKAIHRDEVRDDLPPCGGP
jgi:hypothetical protein